MDISSSGNNPCEIPEVFVKEQDQPPPMAGHGNFPMGKNCQCELIQEEETTESLLEALGRCGLFSQETDKIPDILAFNDCVFDEKYYREKHGKAFPEEWYKIMAEVSKKKFEDLRNYARAMEMVSGNFEVKFSPDEPEDSADSAERVTEKETSE